jgi:hypothetical protein
MDLIGPLPESLGFNTILVIVDYYSKMLKLEPTTIKANTRDIGQILRKRIFRDYGFPKIIVHDSVTRCSESHE